MAKDRQLGVGGTRNPDRQFRGRSATTASTPSDLGRRGSIVRFSNGQIPPDTLRYLDFYDTRPDAVRRLKSQARTDMYVAKSACDDGNNRDEGVL